MQATQATPTTVHRLSVASGPYPSANNRVALIHPYMSSCSNAINKSKNSSKQANKAMEVIYKLYDPQPIIEDIINEYNEKHLILKQMQTNMQLSRSATYINNSLKICESITNANMEASMIQKGSNFNQNTFRIVFWKYCGNAQPRGAQLK